MRTLLAASALVLGALVAAAAPGAANQNVRETSGPVLALAADGDRAAFVVQGRFKQCMSVMVWQPQRRRVDRLQAARTCETNDRGWRTGPSAVALAGTRAVWRELTGGNTLETILRTATLARQTPAWVAIGYAQDGVVGSFARPPAGDGSLIAFSIEKKCSPDYDPVPCPPGDKPGDIVESIVWRVGGSGRCPNAAPGSPVRCSVVARADGELTVLAADAGRLVARTDSGVRVLTVGGRVLAEVPVRPSAASLSGSRLAVRTTDAVEVYDLASGDQTARFAVAKDVRLQDLERDILVTASGRTVTLRRLDSGRTSSIRVGQTALARLEPSGLFTAGARRVTFTPMRDVLRRLSA
jgi:hypothetical protein